MFLALIIGRLNYEHLHHLAIVLESHEYRSCLWKQECKEPVVILIHAWLWNNGKVVKVLVIEPTYNQSKKHTSFRKISK